MHVDQFVHSSSAFSFYKGETARMLSGVFWIEDDNVSSSKQLSNSNSATRGLHS